MINLAISSDYLVFSIIFVAALIAHALFKFRHVKRVMKAYKLQSAYFQKECARLEAKNKTLNNALKMHAPIIREAN